MTTLAYDDLSVQGVKPGQTRGEVLSLLGPPLGDGFREDLPRVLRPPLEQAPVWRYDEIAVFFEEDRVWQVCGWRIEAPNVLLPAEWTQERIQRAIDFDGGIHLPEAGLFFRLGGPYPVQLRRPTSPGQSAHPSLLRHRLAADLGLGHPLHRSVTTVFDLEARWEEPRPPDHHPHARIQLRAPGQIGLSFTAVGLWSALQDALDNEGYGQELVEPADVVVEGHPDSLTSLLIHARALATMSGGQLVTTSEVGEGACHHFLQELAVLGRLEQIGSELHWCREGGDSVVVLDGQGQATPALRQATLEGQAFRQGRFPRHLQASRHVILYELNRCYGRKRPGIPLPCIDLTGQSDTEELRLRVLQRGPQPTAYPAIVQARKALTGFEERAWQVGSQSDPDPLERELLLLVEDFPHTVARLEPHRGDPRRAGGAWAISRPSSLVRPWLPGWSCC